MDSYPTDIMLTSSSMPDVDKETTSRSEKLAITTSTSPTSISGTGHDIDFLLYHEHNAGRLVIDPEEAVAEFGEVIAGKLKLSRDGSKILWPQPTDDPQDPQNWSDFRKNVQLFIITLAAIVPSFDTGIGIASVFALANQYNTTAGEINNLTANWNIFLLGWGGIFPVILMRRYGRLPVLFWCQLFALIFLLVCTFAPDLRTFAAMRILNAFFGTCPQVTGLYVVVDLFPFHLQARKLNIWTMGFIVSPFLSPFVFGFLVARASWRWTYGIGTMYSGVVLLLIVLFLEETMYDRHLEKRPFLPHPWWLRARAEVLFGLTGFRMARFRSPWSAIFSTWLSIIWRPHLIGVLLFEAVLFGFGIGITVTAPVYLAQQPPGGYGFGAIAIAANYATPIVAVLIGELLGHYVNDWVMKISIRRNNGVFEAESRLWTCYLAIPLYVGGFVLIGASLQKHLSIAALIVGWGIAEVAIMMMTVALYSYCNDCFPRFQGEISALLGLARALGGFSVAFFQVPWSSKNGALQTFGAEAAIVVGIFAIVVPALQWRGRYLRERFSM